MIELKFALTEMDAAAERLAAWHGPLTGSALQPDHFVFHLLTSRIREKQGDILGAIYEAQTGLQLTAARWSDVREQVEISRLARLYAAYATQSQQPEVSAYYAYQAGIYAACAVNWSMAYKQMLPLVHVERMRRTLSTEQRIMSELIVDFAAYLQGFALETDPLTAISEIRLGPRDANDPFLWLGNRLMNFNPDLCWHGALPIYRWRAVVVPESGQGALLTGRVLAEYGDWLEAQDYFREAIRSVC